MVRPRTHPGRLRPGAAAVYDAPLWTGEWAWFGEPEDDANQVERFMDAMDAHKMGGAWWSWSQACGDPHAVRDGNTGKPMGNLTASTARPASSWGWSRASPSRCLGPTRARPPER
ncbi:hypothetical protein [Rhodococcus sp. ARC_M6]|uniref:hypothetical protein n=1 Tax=Rhodococcus sp. ARC_M6 TaxID=2928852 RepID=UPI001FB2BA62|nr:hypothetical protein [Rhodococcus sp. ARC_M6]MCJ0906606.1 hypothetical protein [Rhodococcus sp. ARC_M6]